MMWGGGWGRCHNIAQESPLRKYECSVTSAVLGSDVRFSREARTQPSDDTVWLGRVERQGQDANLLKGGGSEWE